MNSEAIHDRLLNEISNLLVSSNIASKIAILGNLVSRDHQSIFIVGAGRSGLVGKFFAMRLMHAGFTVHVVGEATAPSITFDDVLVAISSSGETRTVISVIDKARALGVKVVAITSVPTSTIAKLAAETLVLGEHYYTHIPLFPMGTMFELSTLIFLESVIAYIIQKREISEEHMRSRHSNLE